MSVDPVPEGVPSTVGKPGRSSAEIRRDIEIQRAQLGDSVEALRGRMTKLTDWKSQARAHKRELIIGAAAVGFLVGARIMLGRRR